LLRNSHQADLLQPLWLTPGDHDIWSKTVPDENLRHSGQLLGATNIVLLIVCVITVFGDLRTTVNALNSFMKYSVIAR
jgi:uncharacterized membrane protein